ncbi:hypothetical protein GPU89_26220 [Burkholderia cepacia]|nr:hypothetical protein [Burkholderia cepacia]
MVVAAGECRRRPDRRSADRIGTHTATGPRRPAGGHSRHALRSENHDEYACDRPLHGDQRGLPPGLQFNQDTGGIVGTPRKTGRYTFTVTATNDGGLADARAVYTIVVQ